MKLKFKLSVFFVIFIVPYFVFSQSNFKAGYLVTLKGDTLKGYVDYREWDKNPTQFKFKIGSDTKYELFFIGNASAVGINGLEYFEKQVVFVSTDEVALSKISTGPDTSKILDTVFLKILSKGKNISLYSYTDWLKTRYYYSEKGQKDIHEFIHHVYQDEAQNLVETNSTVQLNYLAGKYNPAIVEQVNNIGYNQEDMLKITRLINGDTEHRQTEEQQVSFFAGLGGSYSTIKFPNLVAFENPDKNKDYLMPYLTAGIELYPNKNTQKLLLKFQANLVFDQHELASSIQDYSGTITTTNLNFKQFTLGLSPQILYNFYSRPELKIFAGTGASLNLSHYNNYQYVVTSKGNFTDYTNSSKYPEFDSLWIAVPISAGIIINDRVDFSLYYFFPSSITNFSGVTGDITSYRAAISYLFGH